MSAEPAFLEFTIKRVCERVLTLYATVAVHAWNALRRSNVVVNVRFNTAEAQRLGVDGHVCELQLNLASYVACMVARVTAQTSPRGRALPPGGGGGAPPQPPPPPPPPTPIHKINLPTRHSTPINTKLFLTGCLCPADPTGSLALPRPPQLPPGPPRRFHHR